MNNYFIKIDIGDFVVLKTDKEKLQRICTGITIRQNGIAYELSNANNLSWHYDFEFDFIENIKSIGFKIE